MRRTASLYGLILGLLVGSPALANPQGGVAVHGQVSGLPAPGVNVPNLRITNSPSSIINWQSFGIRPGEITQFIQQSAQSAVLNRVVGGNLSQLMGQLKSNGRVFLLNPNGIIVGQGAVINTARFIASTLDMTDEDFIAGKLRFTGDGNSGSIENRGFIKANDQGDILLVAPSIRNEGTLSTDGGRLILAAGESVTITSLDDVKVQFEIQAPDNEVVNLGEMITSGGAAAVFAGTIRNSGTVNANSIAVDSQGRIQLVAKSDLTLEQSSVLTADGPAGGVIEVVSAEATTIVRGELSAEGAADVGGRIHLLGDRVGVGAGTEISVVGETGGGEILVGGDYQGVGDTPTASQTFVGPDAILQADAAASGDGGKIIVWADEATRFYGQASARGGEESGDGGFVEISGKHHLKFEGEVDTTAANGQTGTLLLDPDDIVIHNGGGQLDDGEIGFADGLIDFADGGSVTFDISELAVEGIGSATNVIFRANNSITINSLTSDGVLSLDQTTTVTFETGAGGFTMSSFDEIDLTGGASLTIDATAGTGSGGVTIGSITTTSFGAVDITGTSIQIDGAVITDSGAITFTATAGDINLDTVNTNTGAIIINALSDINVAADLRVTTSTGSINLDADTDGDGTGTLTVQDGATLSKAGLGVLTITAADIDLQTTGAIDADQGQIQIFATNNGNISVGTSTSSCGGACEMIIDASELSRITIANPGLSMTVGDNTHAGIFVGPITEPQSNGITGGIFIQSGGSVTFEGVATFNELSAFADQGVFVNFDLDTDAGSLALDGDNDLVGGHVISVADGVTIASRSLGGFINLVSATDVAAGAAGATFISDGTIQISGDFDSTGQTGFLTFSLDDDDNGAGNFNAIGGANLTFGAAEVVIIADDIVIGAAGSLSGTNRLKFEPADMVTSIGVGQAGDMTIDATEIGLIADGFAVGWSIGVGGYTGSIDIGTVSFSDPIEFLATGAGGSISVNGTLTGTDDAEFLLDGPGATTTLAGNILTFGNAITISDNVVLNSASVTLDTTNGGNAGGATITITGTVDDTGVGASSLTLNGGTSGTVDLQGDVGGVTPNNLFTIADAGQVFLPNVTANGTINVSGVNIDLLGTTYTSTTDQVLFANVATVDVLANATITAGANNIAAGTVNISGNTLTLASNAGIETINLTGSTLFAPGMVNVTTLNWSGISEIDGAGTGAFQVLGTTTVTGSSTVTLDQVTFQNPGTFNYNAGSSILTLSTGAELLNLNIFNFVSGAGVLAGAGSGVFFNDGGTVNLSAPSQIDTAFDNDGGTVELGTSNLTVTSGGIYDGSLTVNSAGSTELFMIGGTYQFNAGTSIDGTGALNFDTGTWDVQAGTLTLNSVLNWTAPSTIDGGGVGTFAIASGGVINFTVAGLTAASPFENITVSNAGTFNYNPATASALTLRNGAIFNNEVGGIFDFQADFVVVSNAGVGTFNNLGTVQKTGGAGTSGFVSTTGTMVFNNPSGLIDVDTGLIQVNNNFINGGTIDVALGTEFEVTGTFTNSASGIILGIGTVDPAGGGNTLLNSGIISPGVSPGILTVAGNVTFSNGGQFDVELAGSGNVAGTDYDQLVATGTVTIDPGAILNLMTFGGYTGVTNDIFTDIIDATGALNGEFDTVLQPGTLIAQTTYVVGAPGDLTLDVLGTGTVNQWTNPASGSFNLGGNWSLLSVPDTGELAFIGIGGITVSNSGTVTVDELSLVSSSTLQLLGGSITISNDSVLDGVLLMNGGDLIGPPNLTVNGLLDWRQGTMSGAGTTFANGGITVTTNSGSRRLNGRDLDSTATFILGQTTNFTIDGGATLDQSGGIFDLRGNSSINTNTTGNVVSSVPVQKTGSFNTSISTTNFTNTGDINVNVGELVLTTTGTHLETNVTATVADGTTLDIRSSTTGTYNNFDVVLVGAGSTFEMGGTTATQTYDAASSITGPGDVIIAASGTLNFLGPTTFSGNLSHTGGGTTTFAQPVNVADLTVGFGILHLDGAGNMAGTGTLSGGTLTGLGDVTYSGLLAWLEGTMETTGAAKTFANGGITVTTNSGSRRLNGRDLDSTATFILGQMTNFTINGGATLDQSGGIFDLRGNSSINTNTTGNVVSSVPVQKTGSFSTSIATTTFTNSGNINVNTGTLFISPNFINTATATIASGTTLTFAGTTSSNAASGTIQGTGTLNVSSTAFTNNGVLGPGTSPGIFNINGNATLANGSQLNIELAGSSNVAGTDFDQLVVMGTLTIDPGAILNLTTFGGYTGVVSDTFTDVIDATGALNGEFDTVLMPATLIAQSTYVVGGPGDLSLLVTSTGTINQWTNPASGAFDVGGNWSLGVPSGTHETVIGIGGITVTHGLAVADTVLSLSLVGSSTFALTAGSLTINTNSILDGNLSISGGATLLGAGDVTVNGTFNANTTSIIGTGTEKFITNGTSNISGAFGLDLRPWDNFGTVNWTAGDITLAFGASSVFTNEAGGIFNINTGLSSEDINGAGSFVNDGVVNKNSNLTTSFNVPVTNTNAFNLTMAQVSLRQTSSNTGTFSLSGGTTLAVANASTLNLNLNTAVMGTGTVLVEPGTTLSVNVPVAMATGLILTNDGTIANAENLTIPDTFNLVSGTVTGTGTFTTPATSTTTLNGGTNTLGAGLAWDSFGLVNWTAGDFTLSDAGSVFTVEAGAPSIFNINTGLSSEDINGAGSFVNDGVVNKNSNLTTSFNVPVTNTNAFNLTMAQVSLRQTSSNTGTFSLSGGTTLAVANASTLNLNLNTAVMGTGTVLVEPGTTLSVNVPVAMATGLILTNDGTIANAENLTIPNTFNLVSGAVTGTGTFTTPATSTTTLSAGTNTLGAGLAWDSFGLVNWTAGDFTLSDAGSVFTVEAGAPSIFNINTGLSSEDINGAGSFVNDATLNKSSGVNTVFNVPFTNTGTVVVQNGTQLHNVSHIQTAGITLLIGGSIAGTAALNIDGGVLQGGGIGNISTNININSGGALGPGLSLDTMNVTGNVVFNNGGAYNVEVAAGLASDVLNVTGSVTINAGAILNVSAFGGYTGVVSDNFTGVIATTGALNGTFTTINQDPGFNVAPSYTVGGPGDLSLLVSGFTNIWIGPLGGGLWSVPGNWSLIAVPIASHDVLFNTAANVNQNIGGTINSINTIAGSTLTNTSGTLTINSNSILVGSLTISGGTLTGTGDIIVTGLTSWSGTSTIGGLGTSLFADGGLNLTTAVSTTWTLDRALVLGGNSSWSPNTNQGGKVLTGAGSITNNAILDLTPNDFISPSEARRLQVQVPFTNTAMGTVTKSGGNVRADFQMTFDNAGVVEGDAVVALTLSGGGTHTGDFNITAGNLLQLVGVHTLSNTTSISGDGTLDVLGIPGGLVINGTVAPGASIGTLSVTGNVTFNTGGALEVELGTALARDVLSVNGQVDIIAGAVLNIIADPPYTGVLSDNFTGVITTTGMLNGTFTTINQDPNFSVAPSYTIGGPGDLSLLVSGFTNTWIGLLVGGLWNVPGNWSLAAIPIASHDVLFNTPANVNQNIGGTINSINTIAGSTLTNTSGTLTINNDSMLGGNIIVSGSSTLTGPGNVTVTGLTNWAGNGTTIDGSGTLFANGGFDINAGGGTSRTLNRLVVIDGNSTWTDSFGSNVFGTGTIRNLLGNTITATNTADFNFNPTLDNLGTFTQTGSGTFNINGGLTNNNIVNANGGKTAINTNGTVTGAFNIGPSGILAVTSGTTVFDALSSITGTGAGAVNFDTSATVDGTYNVTGNTLLRNTSTVATFNTAAQMGSLTLTQNGPRLTGSGNVTVTGLTNWAGGGTTIDGSGTLFANGGFDINAGGGTSRTLNRLVVIDGNSTWTNSFSSNVFGTGTIRNLLGNTITATNTADFNFNPTLDNLGTFTQTGSGTFNINGALTNNNIVNANGGKTAINTNGTVTGAFNIGPSGILAVTSGTTVFDALSSITGTGAGAVNFDTSATVDGTYNVTGNTLLRNTSTVATFNTAAQMGSLTLTQNGPRLTGSGNVTVTGLTNWAGGGTTIDGSGTLFANGGFDINAGGGTSRTLNRLVVIDGNSTWTNSFSSNVFGTGTIRNLLGNTITATNTADFNFNPTLDNLGTFTQTGSGTFNINGALTNNNIVNVQAGRTQVNSTFTNNGTINLGGGIFAATGATFDNAGTIQGTSTLNVSGTTFTNQSGGIVAPGTSIGTMLLTGNAIFASGSIFRAEVENGTSDVLAATGTVTIQPGAILDILLSGGPAPVGGEMFNVITGATVVTTFDTVLEPVGLSFGQANPGGTALELTLLGGANTWTGPLVGEFWGNAGNWTLGVPSMFDDVIINTAATITHNLLVADTINSLTTIAGSLLDMTGGSLDIVVNSILGGELRLAGGDVGGAGNLTVNTLTHSAGTLGSSGTVMVSNAFNFSGGTLAANLDTLASSSNTLSGAAAKTISGVTWNTFGPTSWTAGDINLVGGATINNQSGAVWNILTVGSADDMQGAGTFNSLASSTVNANAPGGSNSIHPTTVNHAGTINVLSGDLDFAGPGTSIFTFSGPINFSNGTRIKPYTFAGAPTLNFNTGTSISVVSGTAEILVDVNVPVNFNAPLVMPNNFALNQSSGTVTVNAAVTVGDFNQTGGTFTGAGNLTATNSFTQSAGSHAGAGMTTLGPAVVFAPGGYTFNRLFDIDGTLNHGVGTLTTNNLVNIDGAFNWTGGTVMGNFATGATSNTTINGTSILDGTMTSAGVTQVNGLLQVQTGGVINVIGGVFGGNGVIDVSLGTLTNTSGTVTAGTSPGFLSIIGNFTQGALGTLLVDLAAPGLTPGADFDFISITGTANLGGTLLVNPLGGFIPPTGTGFDILNFSAVNGNFASIASTSTQTFSGVPGATNFVLTAGTPPAIPMMPIMMEPESAPPLPPPNQEANVIGDIGGSGIGSGFGDGTGTDGDGDGDDDGSGSDGSDDGDGDTPLPQLCSA